MENVILHQLTKWSMVGYQIQTKICNSTSMEYHQNCILPDNNDNNSGDNNEQKHSKCIYSDSSHGTRLRKSAPTFSRPWIALITYRYGFKASAQHIKRQFWYCVFPRYWSGWWSVSRTNSFPYKYSWNLVIPKIMARHYFAIVEYQVSLGSNFRLANATGCFTSSSSSLRRTAPTPISEASVCKKDILWRSASCSIGGFTICCFSFSNASICVSLHWRWFGAPLRVASVSGAATVAKFGMKCW